MGPGDVVPWTFRIVESAPGALEVDTTWVADDVSEGQPLPISVRANMVLPDAMEAYLVWKMHFDNLPGGGLTVSDSTIIFWRWRLGDRARSGHIAVELFLPNRGFRFKSHTKSHYQGLDLQDPPGKWVTHGFYLVQLPPEPSLPPTPGERIRGILLAVHYPVEQTFELDSLYIGPAPPGFRPTPWRPRREGPAFAGLPRPTVGGALEDVDRDGELEAILLSGHGETGVWLLGRPRTRSPVTRLLLQTGIDAGKAQSAFFFDLDADGDKDVILLGAVDPDSPEAIRIYENRGHFAFRRRQAPDHDPVASYGTAVAWHPGLRRYVFYSNFVGFFQDEKAHDRLWFLDGWDPIPLELPAAWRERISRRPAVFSSVFSDLDLDGYPDLVVASNQNGVRILPGTPEGLAQDPLPVLEGGGKRIRGEIEIVLPADFDADGDPDLFVCIDSRSFPDRLLRNEGDFRFTDVTFEAGLVDSARTEAGAWADFDNDGDLDLFLANVNRPCALFLNRGDGTFARSTSFFERVCLPLVALVQGDLDRDGDEDLLLFQQDGYPVLLENHVDDGGGFSVRLEGPPLYPEPVGARLVACDPNTGEVLQTWWWLSGCNMGTSWPAELHVGFGDRDSLDLLATYPDGSVAHARVRRGFTGVLTLKPPPRGFGEWVRATLRREWLWKVRSFGARHTEGLVAVALVASLVLGFLWGYNGHLLPALLFPLVPLAQVQLIHFWTSPLDQWEPWTQLAVFLAAWVGASALKRRQERLVSPGDLAQVLMGFGHSNWGRACSQVLRSCGDLSHPGLPPDKRRRLEEFLRDGAREALRGLPPALERIIELSRATLPRERKLVRHLKQHRPRLAPLLEFATRLEAGPGSDSPASRVRILSLQEEMRCLLRDLDTLEDRLLARRKVSLRACLRRHMAGWRRLAAERGLALECELPEEDPLFVFMDASSLEMCLDNLIQNAAECAGGTGSHVRIEVRLRGRWVEADIRDDGPGIPEGLRTRIFEPGYSTHGRKRGQGLWWTRRELERFAGELLLVEAEPGQTRFRMRLRWVSWEAEPGCNGEAEPRGWRAIFGRKARRGGKRIHEHTR
jgi:signal transduction histidine kinase